MIQIYKEEKENIYNAIHTGKMNSVVLQLLIDTTRRKPLIYLHYLYFFMSIFVYFIVVFCCVSRETMVYCV